MREMDLKQYPLIETISPEKIKQMNNREIEQFTEEVRTFLTKELSTTGGHIAPNLGVVELTVALFRSFESQDAVFWDIGHQTYVHKIITGRASQFDMLRKYGGLSGFLKMAESSYDKWEAGHASTSLSGATGLAVQRKLRKEKYHIVGVIGDGALTGGMALEALNHIGHIQEPIVIILNDNNMSISKNVGGLNTHINHLRANIRYMKVKKGTQNFLAKSKIGRITSDIVYRIKNGLKKFLLPEAPQSFFEAIGLQYIGPLDGHNVQMMEAVFEQAKNLKVPAVIHILTQKGRGYTPAEQDEKGAWHGIGPFSYETGEKIKNKKFGLRQWSSVISETVERFAQTDDEIVVVTPAMLKGSKLTVFEQKFPERTYDVGIAEEHAMTFSAGIALEQKAKPFLAIYSSFLQRAYDQLLHDVARQNLHVVIGVDRCGFAGGDGETHHGIYDISIMRTIPNMIIMMGKDDIEAQYLLYSAFYHYKKSPSALRYPRGYIQFRYVAQFEHIPLGSWEYLQKGEKIAFLTFGPQLQTAQKVADSLREKTNTEYTIVNARFIKPMDEKMLHEILQTHDYVVTIEEGCRIGGFASGILEFMALHQYKNTIDIFAIDDSFIEQGDNNILRALSGIDKETILTKIKERLSQ